MSSLAVSRRAQGKATRWIPGVAPWAYASAFLGLAAFESFIARAQPQVPYMDSMRFMWHLDRLLTGQLSWLQIWNGGEHRGLWFPLVQLVEWLGWGLDARVSTRLTGLVVLASFGIWVRAWTKGAVAAAVEPPWPKWIMYAVPAVASVVAFSPAAFELWLLDLGFAQALKNLLVIGFLALWALEISGESRVRRPWLGLAGAVLVLVVTYGWSYLLTAAAVSAALLVRGGAGLRERVILVAPLLASQFLYVLAGRGVLTRGTSVLDAGGASAFVQGALLGAGSTVVNYESAMRLHLGHAGLMLLGLLLLAVVAYQFLRAIIHGVDALRAFHVSAAVYGLGTLAATAFARSGEMVDAAAASRYFVDYQWIVLGALGLACDTRWVGAPVLQGGRLAQRAGASVRVDRVVLTLLLVVAAAGQLATWRTELKLASARAGYFENMRRAFLAGAGSEQDAALLQAPVSDARRGLEVARRYALGPYRTLRSTCSLHDAVYEGEWHAPADGGARWLGTHGAVMLTGCSARVGFDVFIPATFPARTMTVSSTAGPPVTLRLVPGEPGSVAVRLPADDRFSRVEFSVDAVTVPRAAGLGIDERALGVLLTGVAASVAN